METYISKEEMLKYFIAGMGDEREELRRQERNQIAINALKEGLPLQIVSKITSLPIAEIKKLQGQL